MNSIFLKLRLLIVGTSFVSAISFGGSVSGGGGNSLPPDPIGSAKVVEMLPKLRGPMIGFFWALEQSLVAANMKEYSVFFNGPVTVYEVINSLEIQALVDAPCLDSSGIEVDGSVYNSPSNGVCISALRLGSKLDEVNAYTQTLSLVIHEISHKFGFDEEAATKFQSRVFWFIRFDSLNDFEENWYNASGRLSQIFRNLDLITPNSNWNLVCTSAQEIQRQYDQLLQLFASSQWTSVLRWKRSSQVLADRWNVLGLQVAGCGQADSPLKNQENEKDFKRYSEVFANSNLLTIETFTKKYTAGEYTEKSSQEILNVDTISAAVKESERLRDRAAIFLEDLGKLKGEFVVTSEKRK
ncbi:MAG: hypothetical protein WCI18_09660 [Pseudomonadota bacterium]